MSELKQVTYLERLYRSLWDSFGDEPWTNKIRREQLGAPLMFMLIFLGLGILLYAKCHKYWWQLLIGIIVGIILGHLFW